MDENLQRLKVFKELDDQLTKKYATTAETAAIVKTLIDAIRDIKSSLEAKIGTHNSEWDRKISSTLSDLQDLDLKAQKLIIESRQSSLKDVKDLAKQLTDEINRVKDLIPDSFDPSELEQKLVDLESKIPEIIPETSEAIRDKLETLKDEERLDASAIKNLPTSVEKIIRGGTMRTPEVLVLGEQLASPGPKVNHGLLYVKDNGAGSSALYFLDDQGLETQLGSGSGTSAFLGLTDAPHSYAGQVGKLVAVNGTEDALEFVDASTGAVTTVFGRAGDVAAQANDYTWAQVDKTLADITDIPLRSHTNLQDIGTNTHADIDTHIASTSNPHSVTAVQTGAVPLVGGATISNNIEFADAYPTGPGTTPTLPDELVDLRYVTALAQGFTFKEAVRVATTANITLSGAQTIDGVSVVAGDRVLVKNQSNPIQNGIYEAASAGWTRTTDFDQDAEVFQGAAMLVLNGSTQVATQWAQNAVDPIVGTDPITFIQISAPVLFEAGDGLDLASTTFSLDLKANDGLAIKSTELGVDYDDSSIGIVTNKLAVKAGGVTNAMLAGSIADSKLLTISTAGKVSGAALTSLSSTPSGAGIMPIANLATGTPTGSKFIRDDGVLAVPAGGGTVQSVTGLNTNNADPANPVVRVSVDGSTITGSGTPADPLVSVGAGSSSLDILTITGTVDDSNVTFTATEEPGLLVINGAIYKTTGGAYTWSYSVGTITLSTPVGTGGTIYGLRSGSNGGGIESAGITIDGGGNAISTGSKGYISFPYGGTVSSWTILADQSGSIVVDVKKCTYGGFPTTSTIAGSEKPTLSSAQKNQDVALSSFSTTITAGDIWEFVVDSASTVTRVHLIFKIIKE